jgi:regulator of sigma E protease
MILQSILSLLITLGILVTVHEFGHFWVARKCGVKVLRFSVGFGKPIFIWKDKRQTEFAIAAIPLGGYVKMLDEREGEVAEDELNYAFNRQTPVKRIAIAAAGPIANFLFAIFAYWCMFWSGFNVLSPVIGSVVEGSLAAQAGMHAGDEIIALDGEPISSWNGLAFGLVQHMGDSDQLQFKLKHKNDAEPRLVNVQLNHWLSGKAQPDPIKSLGILPFSPQIPATVGEVVPSGSAYTAGLKAGDKIIKAGDVAISNWMQFVKLIQKSPDQRLLLMIQREGQTLDIPVVPASRVSDENGVKKTIGFIGVRVKSVPWPKEMIRNVSYGPFESIPKAIEKTWSDINLTLVSIKKMIEGVLSVKNLSGPISIAQMANASISSGAESFIRFLAILSVSLGVLNLLPIPVLDGGHLLYYSIEWIRGKPLSEAIQQAGLKIGVSLILMLMVLAFYNDLSRLM